MRVYMYVTCIVCTPVGEEEDLNDKLRSILSQFEYVYQVSIWEEKGVQFKKHFYVPEVHPLTRAEFHEREDDAHVLKVVYMYWLVVVYSTIQKIFVKA